jgi:hypothetical protein
MLAGVFLVFAGAKASAADRNVMEVTVPFPFVAQGRAFPAGQYTVTEEGGSIIFLHGEKGNHVATFVMTRPASGHDPAGERPALTFTRHENQNRLSSIWESGGQGWSVIGQ